MKSSGDRFGFRFWLFWILWFAASLVAVSFLWYAILEFTLGGIRGPEKTFLWSVAVFGSWFLLLIPFIRKKEQVWKRLNRDEEKAAGLWLKAMGIFTGLLVLSCFFWTLVLGGELSTGGERGLNPRWVKAVFGTWLFLLLPFLVWMYRSADRIFKQAVIRQKARGPRFRSVFMDKSRRLLPDSVARKLKSAPPTLKEGHIVTLLLKQGRRIPHVFVLNFREILGVYDRTELGFEPQDVLDAEPALPGELPSYEEEKWLRLDGRA